MNFMQEQAATATLLYPRAYNNLQLISNRTQVLHEKFPFIRIDSFDPLTIHPYLSAIVLGKPFRRFLNFLEMGLFSISGWLVGFYGISTFVGYLMPNLFFIQIVLFQTIQFRISMQFKCKYSLIVKNISISSYSV